jgi:2-polyprenyl-3-methyl-5-hydroxy-6-metoxy-1,4-benzoquinol methylase
MGADENFFPKKFQMGFTPFLRHFERYYECIKFLKKTGPNELWLDCACGSGYGTNLLSNFAHHVIGYDINIDAINYAQTIYKTPDCTFVDHLSKLDVNQFNVIFSIETIEHMPYNKGVEFLTTLNILLKNNGDFIITTPIVPETNYKPSNKFHCLEYSNDDFIKLLNKSGFKVEDSYFIETTFTDNETKSQGYYKCQKK